MGSRVQRRFGSARPRQPPGPGAGGREDDVVTYLEDALERRNDGGDDELGRAVVPLLDGR